jgi:hypothetical protein
MRAIEHDLADASKSALVHEKLLEKYAGLQHDYEHADGYTLHAEVERVLTGVGFCGGSGSYRSRHSAAGSKTAMLARVL